MAAALQVQRGSACGRPATFECSRAGIWLNSIHLEVLPPLATRLTRVNVRDTLVECR